MEGVVVRVELDARFLHLLAWSGRRNVKGGFGVKIQRRRHVEAAEGPLHGRLQNGHDGPLLLKLGLHLGRVDVHIHTGSVHRQKQRIEGKLPGREQTVHGPHHGPMKSGVLDETAVDKEELLTPGAAGKFGLAHEARELDHVGLLLHRHEALVVFRPEDPNQSLAQAACGQIE